MLGYWYKLYTEQTPFEEKLEMQIAKLGYRYRTQHPFLAKKAFVDFYFPDQKLVVEVDDPSHEKRDKKKKDLQRTQSLEAIGLKVIRFTNKQVGQDLPTVVSKILEELINRTASQDGPDPS